jgi:hypothetical protein
MPGGFLFGHNGDLRGMCWEHVGQVLGTSWELFGNVRNVQPQYNWWPHIPCTPSVPNYLSVLIGTQILKNL